MRVNLTNSGSIEEDGGDPDPEMGDGDLLGSDVGVGTMGLKSFTDPGLGSLSRLMEGPRAGWGLSSMGLAGVRLMTETGLCTTGFPATG